MQRPRQTPQLGGEFRRRIESETGRRATQLLNTHLAALIVGAHTEAQVLANVSSMQATARAGAKDDSFGGEASQS
jgi:hypothetical protein